MKEVKASDYMTTLNAAVTEEEELRTLGQLTAHLESLSSGYHGSKTDERSEDYLEENFLRSAVSRESFNPFPSVSCVAVFCQEHDLRDFVSYLFLRRYGRSESITDEYITKVKSVGQASFNATNAGVPLNNLLDRFLLWLTSQPISAVLLGSYEAALQRAAGHHIVRKLLVQNIMTWLTRHICEMDPALLDSAKGVVMCCLSDCWSAVRCACAAKLGKLLDKLTTRQLESFYASIIKVCSDTQQSWQAQEGAAMALGAVVKRCHSPVMLAAPSKHDPASTESTNLNGTQVLKFGKDQLRSRFPAFLSGSIFNVTYQLLRHVQLSIREFGIKALSSYLMYCHPQEAVQTLQDVVSQLRNGCGLATQHDESGARQEAIACAPHRGVWIDAYAAEGLLGVCIFLAKHIPSHLLLPCWWTYFSTFSLLLMHPASTVRQAASTVFKFIVSRGSSNPMILWLVLHGLSVSWEACNENPHRQNNIAVSDGIALDCVKLGSSAHGVTRMTEHSALNSAGPDCVADVAKNRSQPFVPWEFSEGRLLTYELILHFLNKNHWLYVFAVDETVLGMPSVGYHRPSALTASCSGTEIHTGRCGTPKELGQLSKMHTYGGAALKACLKIGVVSDNTASNPTSLKATLPSRPRHRYRSGGRCFTDELTEPPKVKVSDSAADSGSSSCLTFASCSLLQSAKALHNSGNHAVTASYLFCTPQGAAASGCLPLNAVHSSANLGIGLPSLSGQIGHDGCAEIIDARLHAEDQPAGGEHCPFSATFELMFLQTVGCIASPRWELQRIGCQVLPCLIETIGWYDTSLLEAIWHKYLMTSVSADRGAPRDALCYASCLSLLYTLQYSVRLRSLLTHSDDESGNLGQAEAKRIIDCVDQQLPRLLPHVAPLVSRPVMDKVSAVALQTIALALSTSDHLELGAIDQYVADIANLFISVAMTAHPDLKIVSTQMEAACRKKLALPEAAFLRLCAHEPDREHCSNECSARHLVAETSSYLLALVKRHRESTRLWHLLPVLTYHACTTPDDTVRKNVVDSINILLKSMEVPQRSVHNSSSENNEDEQRGITAACISLLCQTIEAASAETASANRMRLALDLLASVCLCQGASDPGHFRAAIACLCGKLQQAQLCNSLRQPRHEGVSTVHESLPPDGMVTAPDLRIILRGICRDTSVPSSLSASDMDDEDISGSTAVTQVAVLPESEVVTSTWCGDVMASQGATLLPTTNHHLAESLGLSSSLPDCINASESDDASAWDSCDEPDEEEPALGHLFTDCISKVVVGLVNLGQRDRVAAELRRLPEHALSIVKVAVQGPLMSALLS